jgi:hypothetical protein
MELKPNHRSKQQQQQPIATTQPHNDNQLPSVNKRHQQQAIMNSEEAYKLLTPSFKTLPVIQELVRKLTGFEVGQGPTTVLVSF